MQEINYKKYFDMSPDAIFVLDKNGNFIDVNESAGKMLGYTREELLAKTILDILCPGKKDAPGARIENLQKNIFISDKPKFICKNGKRIDVSLDLVKISEDKQAVFCRNIREYKLAESRYEMLFKNMVNGFARHKIITDENGRAIDYVFLEVNDAFEKLTGLKREAIINKKVTDVLPGIEKDPADWIGKYGEVALKGKKIKFEEFSEPLHKWFQISAYSMKPGYFHVLIDDITERRQFEDELKKGQEYYKYLIESLDEIVLIINKLGKIVFANKKAYENYGYAKDEFIGSSIIKFLSMSSAKKALFALSQEFLNIDHGGIELDVITKTGEIRILKVAPNSIMVHEGKKTIGLLVNGHDVTEEKKKEKEIESLANEWSATFDSMNDGISLQNTENMIINANKAFCRILRKKKEEILNKKCFDVFDCKTADMNECPLKKNRANIDKKLERFDEKLGKWLSISASFIYDENGNVDKLIHVIRDISESKEAEKETERRNRQLEKFNALMVGREEKMIELKKRIRELESKN